jgi:hypothetical protein
MKQETRYQAMAIKTWILSKTDFTETDIIYLRSTGCEIEVNNFEPIEIFGYGKVQLIIPRFPEVYIKTTCPKQESMLQLKYSEFLHHTGTSYESIDMASHFGPAAR